MSAAAIIAFYLAALLTSLAYATGTCTQNSADELGMIVLAYPVYAFALVCLAYSKAFRFVLAVCSPILLVVLWQTWFAVQFAVRTMAYGASACEVLWGNPYGQDGSEKLYAILWLAAGFGVPLALIWVFWARRRLLWN